MWSWTLFRQLLLLVHLAEASKLSSSLRPAQHVDPETSKATQLATQLGDERRAQQQAEHTADKHMAEFATKLANVEAQLAQRQIKTDAVPARVARAEQQDEMHKAFKRYGDEHAAPVDETHKVDVPENAKELAKEEDRLRRSMEKAIGDKNNSNSHPEPAKVVGVVLNGKDDLILLKSSLWIGSVGSAAVFVLFVVLRKLFPLVYLREQLCTFDTDSTEHSSTRTFDYLLDSGRRMGWLDFLYQVFSTCPEDEVRLAGLDGWALLEFCRMNCRIISIIGPLLCCTLLPMHYYASTTEETMSMDWLSRLDVGSHHRDEWVLWAHAVCVWFVVMVACWQIIYAHESFLQRRYHWLANIPRPRATTVMVTNIPMMYRSDRSLKDYFSSLFPDGSVERTYVVRKVSRLPMLVQQLADARYWAKAVYHQMQRADSSNKQEDAAEYERCQLRSQCLTEAVSKEQELIEAAVDRGDHKICSSSGFVTFTSELTQRQALREQFTREVTEFIMLAPPEPQDVLYQNLAEDEMNASSWGLVGLLSLLAVFIFWVPIVVIISGWITLSSIQGQAPVLTPFLHNYPVVEQLLSGVLATAALKLFMSFLPTILYSIIESTFHLKSGAQCQLKLQQWLTAFLLLFVVMVTTLGRGLTITLVIIASEPAKIISLLASSLPYASHFYFSYTILGWIALPAEALRLANLVKFLWFTRVSAFGEETAKQYSEPEHAPSYGMGTRMSMLMLVSATTFLFSSCSPLILVFTMVYFLLAQVVYGYLLIFGESKKPDMGGLFWIQALDILFVVLLIYVLLMVGVVRLLSASNNWLGPPLMVSAATVILYLARSRVTNLAFHTLPLEEVVRATHDKEELHHTSTSKRPSGASSNGFTSLCYIQPECDHTIVLEEKA